MTSPAVVGALDGFLARSRDAALKQLENADLPPDQRRRIARSLAHDAEPFDAGAGYCSRKGRVRIFSAGAGSSCALRQMLSTQGDVWILVPDEDLAIVGDLVVAQMPFFDTGCEEGWVKALEAISAAKWERLIPGHGAEMDRAGFNRWRSAFIAFVDCAKSDRPAVECTASWQRDASGFFSEQERESVAELGNYYVGEILRGPCQ